MFSPTFIDYYKPLRLVWIELPMELIVLMDKKLKYIESGGNIADAHEGLEDYSNKNAYLDDSTRTSLKNLTQTELCVLGCVHIYEIKYVSQFIVKQ